MFVKLHVKILGWGPLLGSLLLLSACVFSEESQKKSSVVVNHDGSQDLYLSLVRKLEIPVEGLAQRATDVGDWSKPELKEWLSNLQPHRRQWVGICLYHSRISAEEVNSFAREIADRVDTITLEDLTTWEGEEGIIVNTVGTDEDLIISEESVDPQLIVPLHLRNLNRTLGQKKWQPRMLNLAAVSAAFQDPEWTKKLTALAKKDHETSLQKSHAAGEYANKTAFGIFAGFLLWGAYGLSQGEPTVVEAAEFVGGPVFALFTMVVHEISSLMGKKKSKKSLLSALSAVDAQHVKLRDLFDAEVWQKEEEEHRVLNIFREDAFAEKHDLQGALLSFLKTFEGDVLKDPARLDYHEVVKGNHTVRDVGRIWKQLYLLPPQERVGFSQELRGVLPDSLEEACPSDVSELNFPWTVYSSPSEKHTSGTLFSFATL